MLTLGLPDACDHVRVIFRKLAVRGVAVLLGSSIVLTGCGGEEKKPQASPSPTLPTSNVNVPAGVTLTEPGAELKFGESANVAYEPNERRNTVLELRVDGATKGRVTDLSSYVLDDRTKASTPYYVKVTVKNIGDGDVGQTPIPLWAVDNTNALLQASSFTNAFKKCPSTALPTTFAPNATFKTCLVFLVPDHGRMTGVSYRPLQEFAPIMWKGAVTPPPAAEKKRAS